VHPRFRRPALEAIALAGSTPAGVGISRQVRGGVAGAQFVPDGEQGAARLLYLHGGAYEGGSPTGTHRPLIAALARAAERITFAPRYRLAPEHPAPAALDDALAAYAAVAAEANGVVLAGDSAGGGLALALAQATRDRGLPPPARLALISPWVDLTCSGASIAENAGRDALLPPGHLERGARRYGEKLGVEDPVCSPIRGDLAGLPPVLIHVAGDELLLSDAEALAEQVAVAGGEVDLKVFPGLWHDFHVHTGMLAEADEALEELGTFLTQASPARS
jgi:acetyl esterase/lipase